MRAWETFLREQEKELGESTVKKWLLSLKVSRFDAQNLYLEAKDSFQALWFEEHIRKKLEKSFLNNNFKKIKVHLTVKGKEAEEGKKGKSKTKIMEPPKFQLHFDPVNPHFTFENFFTSKDNQITCQILQDPSDFNPVYLWGPKGVGKTHLLQALAYRLSAEGKKVTYARAETFTEHVVSAIRASEMQIFRASYRDIDVLILDNVHELSHKNATQEELFHTFNSLHLARKQIFLASSLPPSELQFIEPRLISRFEWGITLPLAPYRTEERMEILNLKCHALKFPLHNKVKLFLIETFKSSNTSLIQALEALILRTHAQHEAKGRLSTALTISIAKHYLSDLIEQEEKSKVTPQRIIETVSDHFGIQPDDLLSPSQARDRALPRQIAMTLCRNELKMPYKKIGELFGRDHSTVMSSVKLITTQSEHEEPLLQITKKL
ncbi:MAG: chromosomal replication initiator protein DnaA [Chlamydiia bacterium]|nr:chromosomal replication initiator protein DnaA [Chlamydiia bacterium]